MKKSSNKGFSLIELIIAIAILVVLTGLLAPQFMRYIEKSREAKDMQTLDTVYEAAQVALTDETVYQAIMNVDKVDFALADTETSSSGSNANEVAAEHALRVELEKSLGTLSTIALSSKAGSENSAKVRVCVEYDDTDKTLEVTAYSGTSGSVNSDFKVGADLS
jgi:prepilin-type N-terminal cleavage/methylation domain-containing protein